MFLSQHEAKILKDFGFPQKCLRPGDCYQVDKEEWIVGGRVDSVKPMDEILEQKGTWRPSLNDLLLWLQYTIDTMSIVHDKQRDVAVFYITLTIENVSITAKGVMLTQALFTGICKILLFKQGRPYGKRALQKLFVPFPLFSEVD